MIRSKAARALALGLALALTAAAAPKLAAAAHHERVLQVITVEVKPGKLDRYRQEVKKLAGVLARVGSSGKLRMWEATAAGADTGSILVGIEYPNSAAWAADSAKAQGDAEWQKLLAGLDEVRTVESNAIWRDISPTPGQAAAPGSGVLVITGVQVKPGKLETYRQRIQSGQAIVKRLGAKGQLSLWQADLAGPTTGAVVVGVEYPDVASYVAEQAQLGADAEWQKLVAGLDELRTLGGRSLYQEITP